MMKKLNKKIICFSVCLFMIFSTANAAFAQTVVSAGADQTLASGQTVETDNRSGEPEAQPSVEPSAQPSNEPGVQPGEPGSEPNIQPSAQPSNEPGAGPSAQPGEEPAAGPSAPALESANGGDSNSQDVISKQNPNFVNMGSDDHTAPVLAKITHSTSPSTTSTFTVTAQGVTDDNSGVKIVQFAVWSENGGQDDIKWYDGTKDSSNNWTVTVDAKNHKNDVGTYNIHAYGTDNAGNTGFLGSTSIVMDHRDSKAPTFTGITHSTSPSTTSTFTVTAQGVTDDNSGVKIVQFAVWSENGGQDDIKWYDGTKDSSNNWTVTVDAKNHKNDVGTYNIHAYGTDNAGNTGFLGSTSIVMNHRDSKAPTLGSIDKSPSPCTTFAFFARANGVTDDRSSVIKVQFAVWSENGGQDDIKWYDGVNDGSGNWTANMNAANHKNDKGIYNIHIYGTDSAGNTGFMGATTIQMQQSDVLAPSLASITHSASPVVTPTFQITAQGVTDGTGGSGVKNVQFAVWSENGGQDDIKWYNGINSNGNWTVTVDTKNHKNDVGTYNIHVYGTDNAGNTGFMGSTSIVMDQRDTVAPKLTSITQSPSPSTTPNFWVTANGVTDDKSGVKNVRFAVGAKTADRMILFGITA